MRFNKNCKTGGFKQLRSEAAEQLSENQMQKDIDAKMQSLLKKLEKRTITSPLEGEVCFQLESVSSKVRKQGEGFSRTVKSSEDKKIGFLRKYLLTYLPANLLTLNQLDCHVTNVPRNDGYSHPEANSHLMPKDLFECSKDPCLHRWRVCEPYEAGYSESTLIAQDDAENRIIGRLKSTLHCFKTFKRFFAYAQNDAILSDTNRSHFTAHCSHDTNLFPYSPNTLLPSKKKSAFTLAEVLITLGIIGIVAAMTMPVLITKYQEHVLVNRAKKYYSVIMNAINMYNADMGVIGNDYTALMDASKDRHEIMEEFSKYFNGAKLCNVGGKRICGFNYNIKNIKPSNNGYGKNGVYLTFSAREASILLRDGAIIAIRRETTESGKCEYYFNSNIRDENGNFVLNSDGSVKTERLKSGRCGRIFLDTNGEKGPNRVGSDFFDWLIYSDSINFSDDNGNMNYVLQYNKIQPYEDYTIGGDYGK